MNITKENIDDLNALLSIQLIREDYEEKVNEVLKDYKKKASIKGFRPGKVPIGLIKKMYGPSVKVDEINKIVSEGISKYITEEKIDILGDPLPKADENEGIDFETQEEFNFKFELGLAPEFEIKLNTRTKLPYYEIKIDEKLRNDFVENYKKRNGEYLSVEIADENDMIKGDIKQLDETGNPADEGISAIDSTLSISIIKDEKIKKSFIGKKPGDTVDFDINKAYPNDFEIAGILQKKKEEVGDVKGVFRIIINNVNRFKPAEVNQELFDKIYGDGVVKSEEEFITKVEEEIRGNLKKESDYKALVDTRKLAVEKTKFDLPEEFLKRWLIRANKDLSAEEVEKDFDNFIEDLRWQLIRNKIAHDKEIKIEEEDLLEEARNYTRMQFQQYGLYYAADEQVDTYAKEMLKKEEDYKKITDKVLEEKVISEIKEMIKIENKKVTTDEFNKMFAS
ncbi:MAG: trigger factor [Bacteroidales bacterium]|nr:trigger factor [Bacteroidales bacterium]